MSAVVSDCIVSGATAQGLVNPNSKTDALATFQRRIDAAQRWQTLVFMLGEVDCGFVIWYRATKHQVPVDDQLRHSICSYAGFLRAQVEAGFSVLVLSAPLPTIADGQDWGEVANLRSEVTATQRERTDLTLEYNARLAAASGTVGATFVDVTSPMLDAGTGIIRADLLNVDRSDHHLDDERYADLIAPRLAAAL